MEIVSGFTGALHPIDMIVFRLREKGTDFTAQRGDPSRAFLKFGSLIFVLALIGTVEEISVKFGEGKAEQIFHHVGSGDANFVSLLKRSRFAEPLKKSVSGVERFNDGANGIPSSHELKEPFLGFRIVESMEKVANASM